MSVTIHVDNNPDTRQELLDSLHALYTSSPYMSAYVDVHLVVDRFDRQFNMWRTSALVARLTAQATWPSSSRGPTT